MLKEERKASLQFWGRQACRATSGTLSCLQVEEQGDGEMVWWLQLQGIEDNLLMKQYGNWY